MFIAIESVRVGDTIVEGRDKTSVTKVEVGACSSKGTHINSRYCYDRGTLVQVREKSKDVEETGLGDLEEDLDAAYLQFGVGTITPPKEGSQFTDRALFRKLAAQPAS